MKEIPILLYHNVGHYPADAMEDGLQPETFKRHMTYLAQNDYTVVSVEDALDHLSSRRRLRPKSIALTVDGGCRDAYTTVLPILKQLGFPATFFIIPALIGKEMSIKGISVPCMTWHDVEGLRDAGMEIGLLHNEVVGPKNRRYNEDKTRREIHNSLRILNSNFSGTVSFCAFKEGVATQSLEVFLKDLGFRAVLTQCPTNRKPSRAGVGRIQIDDDDDNIFLTKISRTYLFFKDKRSWKYIRKYKLDKMAHHISGTFNRIKERPR